MLKVKNGVTPKNLVIAAGAANVAQELGVTAVITSGTDSVHMAGSKHYKGAALDFRLLGEHTQSFVEKLRTRLGTNYQVILEPNHVHVEYDPPANETEEG